MDRHRTHDLKFRSVHQVALSLAIRTLVNLVLWVALFRARDLETMDTISMDCIDWFDILLRASMQGGSISFAP